MRLSEHTSDIRHGDLLDYQWLFPDGLVLTTSQAAGADGFILHMAQQDALCVLVQVQSVDCLNMN